MTLEQAALWVFIAFLGLAGSAMWSGTETGFYCLSRVRLDIRLSDRSDRAARRVWAELERPDQLLITVLLGNNACNYLGTLGVTALLESTRLHAGLTAALQVMVLAPLLLVFCESLPKEYARLNADRLPYRAAPVVSVVRVLATVTLVLPALTVIVRSLTRGLGEDAGAAGLEGRRRLLNLIEESAHQGAISGVQGALAERALAFERATVGEVMVPWASVDRLTPGLSAATVARLASTTEKTWLPVVDGRGAVRGVVHAVTLVASPGSIEQLIEQPARLDAADPLRRAMGRLVAAGVGVAVVERRGRPIGLVGKRDLVRPLIGPAPL